MERHDCDEEDEKRESLLRVQQFSKMQIRFMGRAGLPALSQMREGFGVQEKLDKREVLFILRE